MEESIWIKRPKEWIEANPGKGTMYKVLKSDITKEFIADNPTILNKGKDRNPYTKEIKQPNAGDQSGIYLIICENSKSVYVGQSVNIDSRIRNHRMCIKGNNSNSSRVYEAIKKDVLLFGIETFQFVKYKIIKDATSDNLLKEERAVMCEFLESGYFLYNAEVPWSNNFVHCPDKYRTLIADLMKRLKEDDKLSDKIKKLL